MTLKNKLKELEKYPECILDRNYFEYKSKFEQIYEEKANDVKIRSKCKWYEFGENSSKFFLNIEKLHALLNEVRTLSAVKKK